MNALKNFPDVREFYPSCKIILDIRSHFFLPLLGFSTTPGQSLYVSVMT